ncbi:branched-chain amino acid ABC transporter permease [Nitratireductor aestuarii]|uniref:Branched-chain amino acid ABC transporter permease n=1 Tax=Nitratireductor aestuarii TaxID=1735103 RepID=A0A916RRW5_9HYPH|nr:branched-chain amino acid ABC transporter permease [Nitratireductor aestuarii]GGA66659.1 branched-chain amino acid ABC transporter permease [Nitratireductor aestuarii]
MSKTSVIAIALLAVALVAPLFVYPVTLMTILCFIVFACSFNLLLGYTGLLCFGHAMFFGSAAYVAGWLMKTYGLTPEMGILAGGLFSAALGLLVGIIAVRKSGITFAMITFAIAQFVYFILLRSPFTGGEDGLQKIPREPVLGLIDVTRNFNYYYVVLAITVLAVFFFYRIVHSPFGEILKAIRDNDARVESLGMKPERYKLMALVLSAGLAGVAGAMKASVFQFATLTDVSFPISTEVIIMTLLGGLGTLFGPMVGAGFIIYLNEYLASFGEWALISQGIILLLVILFLRRGIVGEFNAWMKRRQAS